MPDKSPASVLPQHPKLPATLDFPPSRCCFSGSQRSPRTLYVPGKKNVPSASAGWPVGGNSQFQGLLREKGHRVAYSLHRRRRRSSQPKPICGEAGTEHRDTGDARSAGASPGPDTLQRGGQMAVRAGAGATPSEACAAQRCGLRGTRGRIRVATAVARAERSAGVAAVTGIGRRGRAIGPGKGRRAGA